MAGKDGAIITGACARCLNSAIKVHGGVSEVGGTGGEWGSHFSKAFMQAVDWIRESTLASWFVGRMSIMIMEFSASHGGY